MPLTNPLDQRRADEGQDGPNMMNREEIIDLNETSWTETFRWRTLMLTDRSILLSSIQRTDRAEFKASVGERSLFTRQREIPHAMLVQLTLDGDVLQFDSVDTRGRDQRSRVRFNSVEEALAVTEALGTVKGWASFSVPNPAWRLLVGRGVGLLLIGLGMWLLLGDAQRIAAGEAVDLTGRRKATRLAFWKLAEFLGTTGIWLIGGTAVVALILFTAVQWRGRTPRTVWR